LGLCPALGSIPTGDLAIDGGRTQRLLGSPVRGIERESEEKAEGGWELRREMLSTPKLVVHKSAI
jgi:hypothetical protein